MVLINLYLFKSILKSMLTAWFIFIALNVLFGFLDQLDSVNDDYSTYAAFLHSIFSTAQFAVLIFPLSLLVGTVFALGKLSNQSELTIIFASGISVLRLLMTVLSIALVLLILMMIFKEIVVPKSEHSVKKLLSKTLGKTWFRETTYGAWMIQGDKFLHIKKMKNQDNIDGLSIFSFDDNNLIDIKTAKKAHLGNDGLWSLFSVETMRFTDKKVIKKTENKAQIKSNIDPGVVSKIQISLERLSTIDLLTQRNFLKNNKLNTQAIERELWHRLAYPFTALVMLFFAFPLILKSSRENSLSQKVFKGISLAVVFFVFSEIVKQLGIVFGVPSWMAAFLPSVLFFYIGLRLYRKI